MKGRPISSPIRDDNPCLNCQKPKRHTACHGTCKDHEKWKAEIERVNKNRREYERQVGIGIHKKK